MPASIQLLYGMFDFCGDYQTRPLVPLELDFQYVPQFKMPQKNESYPFSGNIPNHRLDKLTFRTCDKTDKRALFA